MLKPDSREVTRIAKLLIETHGGKSFYNLTEAAKIAGCGINTLPVALYEAGYLVKKLGTSKRISAYELAEFMMTDRVLPIKSGIPALEVYRNRRRDGA